MSTWPVTSQGILAIRLRQIAVVSHLGASDQLYGLGEDGIVYRFNDLQGIWEPLPMFQVAYA